MKVGEGSTKAVREAEDPDTAAMKLGGSRERLIWSLGSRLDSSPAMFVPCSLQPVAFPCPSSGSSAKTTTLELSDSSWLDDGILFAIPQLLIKLASSLLVAWKNISARFPMLTSATF